MAAAKERADLTAEEFCLVCATVTIGLEKLCALECERKLACQVRQGRGRIYFRIQRNDLAKIKQLRSVENLFVVVADIACFKLSVDDNADETLERFYHLPEELEWGTALQIWQEFSSDKTIHNFLPSLKPKSPPAVTLQVNDTIESCNETNQETKPDASLPRFRVTCTRTHSVPSKKHPFTSMQAAAKFGGGINDQFGWIVDLENFDLEVLLNIVDSHVVVGISLTRESLFRRNIVSFGPTTLRSTLAYCLALAADIKKGKLSHFKTFST